RLSRFRFERNCVQHRRIPLAGLGGESNTWKMFKVDEETGTASIVLMNRDLAAADVMLRRRGEIRLVVGASKMVWLVQLLANSVKMGLQIFHAEEDNGSDPVYMEATGDRFKDLVRAMLQPVLILVRLKLGMTFVSK
ncbi:unnamed protein product, partial [Brassica napus]